MSKNKHYNVFCNTTLAMLSWMGRGIISTFVHNWLTLSNFYNNVNWFVGFVTLLSLITFTCQPTLSYFITLWGESKHDKK